MHIYIHMYDNNNGRTDGRSYDSNTLSGVTPTGKKCMISDNSEQGEGGLRDVPAPSCVRKSAPGN